MAPVIRAAASLGVDYRIIHTGQHYSYELDAVFFEELDLPRADFSLKAGSGTHAEETARMLVGIENVLCRERPDVVLVEGDTNSVLAGGLAASKLHIKVGHVEAGLRSRDRKMPEEINRIVVDHISDLLFAPTEGARRNLIGEGIEADRICVTGNTVVDAVYQGLDIARNKVDPLKQLGLHEGKYFLVTAHRAESVDTRDRLEGILSGLSMVRDRFGLPVVFPAHPRTVKRLAEFGITSPRGVDIVQPVGYLEFLRLEESARLVLTDSGGVQEEACILRVPCVTLRDSTERPETVEVGANVLAAYDPDNILRCVIDMLERGKDWGNPFGDGMAGKRIVEVTSAQT